MSDVKQSSSYDDCANSNSPGSFFYPSSSSGTKFILDACCGPKMMWIDKHQKNTIYVDKRSGSFKTNRGEYIRIKPDFVMDYTALDFPDESFRMVVMDPPHIKRAGSNFDLTKKYGLLNPETWQGDLKKGLKECMRVLKPYGILIFKWNDCDISINTILKMFPFRPLFGQGTSSKPNYKTRTIWFTFMKIPI